MTEQVDTEELMRLAQAGDDTARQQLLVRHQARLHKMVTVRLDRRLAARIDPSDIVQEALMDAAQRLSDYLRTRPLPLYPWLRRLTWEHLLKAHQRHLGARKRSAHREEPLALSDESVLALAQRLVTSATSPSKHLVREEIRSRVRTALGQLARTDREVLIMRYLEQLPMRDIASVLETTEAAVKMRHTRALRRLCELLGNDPREDAP